MAKLASEELLARGMVITGEGMANGEFRVRMMFPDGSGYVRTEAPRDEKPSWQRAHYHGTLGGKGLRETCVVQKGMMAMAFNQGEGGFVVKLYHPGDAVTTEPGVEHNTYLFQGSVIHTTKHGEVVGNPLNGGEDWWSASERFDSWSKSLSEEDILRLVE